ncbi:hypothetical protein [Dokdonia sp. LLG6352-1]|uniref:hypothetical protein n=1 Tax=Dokdonia sp. LLG6352-1 TaxID=3160831 RepID=UPI00386BED8F
MRIICLVFFAFILITSCKESNQTEVAPVEEQPAIAASTTNASLTAIQLPSTGKSHLPRLKSSGGKLHMTWVEQEGKMAILKYASYDSAKWSQPRTITSGDNWFVNWADFPALGVNGDYLLTNILEKSAEGTYDYNIKLQLSKGDEIIKDDFLLNTDGVDAEHGFVSIQAYDGGFYATWLDGRNTKNEDESKNQMTLRNAYIDLAGNITQDTEIDNRVCDCCNTATAITNNGPVAVYRDRSDTTPEVRDMAIVRWVDGAWSKPMVIGNDNWELNGCPVNGPAIATKEENVVVSWFTAEGDTPRVLTAFSNDNGASFGGAIRVDNGNAIGRVDTDFMSDGSALISWLEPMGENVVLQVARVYVDGTHDAPVTVTNTSAERQSGFPQLEVVGDSIFVAWTDLNGDNSEVKMVHFEMK